MTTHGPLNYTLYILQSRVNGAFYIGTTDNLKSRLEEHTAGQGFAFRFKLPFQLVYFESNLSFHKAKRRERFLKSTTGRSVVTSLLISQKHRLNSPLTPRHRSL